MLKKTRFSSTLLLTFLIALGISVAVIYFVEQYNYQQKRLTVQKFSNSYVSLIRNNLFQALSATYPLAAFVRTQKGDVQGFTELASEMLPLYPGAASLQLQPGGIIRHIFPLQGNEAAIGHNLLLDPSLNKEAFLAKETRKLSLAGPFNLIQGGIGAAGRLPIYIEKSTGGKEFWGFATVLIRFPDVLKAAKLEGFSEVGLAYELSRIHPETHKIEVIAHSEGTLIENPEEFNIQVPNGLWTLKVSPIKGWRNEIFFFIEGFLGLAFTFLITFSAFLVQRLRDSHHKLEKQVAERTQALRDNLKRLDVALHAARQGWFDLDIQANAATVSNEFPLLLGFAPADFNSNLDEWQENIHPDDVVAVLNALRQCIEAEKAFDIEYRMRAKDESWMWFHSIGEIVEWDVNNNPKRMTGIHTDISERKRSEQVLRVLAESGTVTEGNIFQLMVKQLASAQNTRYALIAQIVPEDTQFASILAIWNKDKYIDNLTFALQGTPCENVVQQGLCFYSENIQQLFPDDKYLRDMQAISYLGVPLKNSRNEVIGLIVVIDDKPMIERPFTRTLLGSLATRAAIEIERIATDAKIKLFSRVYTDTHEGIIITDTHSIIIEVNPTFCEITGYTREDVIGKDPNILSSGKHCSGFYAEMWHSINEQGHWKGEIWNRKKSGELFAELLTISTILDENTQQPSHYVGLFSDITKNKEQQAKLESMAHYDVLTQLPNRILFADRFRLAISLSKRSETLLAICFLDLDKFKAVNDSYGHKVGDQLLVEVAKRIKENIREEDTVSRQGGDEFALLLGRIESAFQCESMLERLHHSLAQPYLIDGRKISISASSGVTLYPIDKADLDTLTRHADQAMYQAKIKGRNRYQLFNMEQDRQIIEKHHQLEEIQRAILNNEFSLYYQPKVNMKTGEVFGVEALIRRIHPEKGLIPPLMFLPTIIETELEIQIGDWVINEALAQLSQWQKQSINIEVSVNISPYHLQSSSFCARLENALAKHATVSHKKFQLEILESSALGDIETISSVIKECRDILGVNVALDDFGTGYSSLTHIRRLAAKTIKIDQSFVRDMLDDPSDYAIIDGVIGLADAFSREVVAEGVESTEDGLMLLIMGCQKAQGYGIARPMPADKIPEWLENYVPNKTWLAFSEKKHTAQELKIKLLKLTMKQWYKKFTHFILATQNDDASRPIINHAKCHAGQWIQRARLEQFFDKDWVNKLEEAHTLMHITADYIFYTYQQGQVETARKELKQMQSIFKQLTQVLEEWD